MNTIQYSPDAVRYMKQVFFLGPPKSSTQTTSRSLQPFLQGSLGDRPIDRPTDHATRLITIYAHWRSQILSLSTATTIDRSDQLQQSAAVRLDGLQCRAICGDTLQYSLKESVSHWRTQQVTQLFTYLQAA